VIRGIDVSHHQGTVNWSILESAYGLSWGAAKAYEGLHTPDSQFAANWRGMKAAGLVRMAYYFAHPDNDGANAAKTFLSYVKPNGIDPTDIMVMDMEGNSNNLPMLAVNKWLSDWADTITAETGRKPFIYTGSGYITNNATRDVAKHYAAWWFPRYPSTYDGNTKWPTAITGYPSPNNWGKAPDIWQFSQSFGNRYDANIADMTLSDLKTRGTIRLELPMTLDQGDKTYIDQRLQAYSFWLDMRSARRELLFAQSNGTSAEGVAKAQQLYEEAYAAWKADQAS